MVKWIVLWHGMFFIGADLIFDLYTVCDWKSVCYDICGFWNFLCEYWKKWLIRILFYHLYQVAFYVNFKCLFFIIPCWTRGNEFFCILFVRKLIHTFAAIKWDHFLYYGRRCSYLTDELFCIHTKLVLMSYLLIVTFLVICSLFPDIVNPWEVVMANRKLLLAIPMSFGKFLN